jgi:hypothetical protein
MACVFALLPVCISNATGSTLYSISLLHGPWLHLFFGYFGQFLYSFGFALFLLAMGKNNRQYWALPVAFY